MYINDKELRSCYDYTNIENQNANVDEVSFNGMTGKMADMVASKDALENYVSETTRKNHESNRVYIHDRSAYTTGQHNCINIPFDDLLNKVVKFRQINTRPASRLSSAGQLIAIFFQAQSNMQFGGCGATHIDTTLVPYYRLSFYKHYKIAMKYFRGSVVANLSREDIMNLSVIDDFYSDDKAYQYAHDETEEELKQTIESLMHNLNSLMSRASNQLPFTSINYGTNTTIEGRRIIRAILNETIKGSGDKGLTYIFPCQIFQCDKDINLYPNTPNYDLFQLALQCSGKRLYPNYANCNWSAESDKHDNKPENIMSTMGCRTYIGYDINGLGWLKDGRGNAFPTTIILPTIAMETLEEAQGLPQQAVIEVFMRKFSMVINDAKNSLIERYNYACSRKPESASFMYENNVIAGYDGKTIRSAMKHMTLGIGILGLAECLQILIGTNQTTKEGMKLAKRICKFHFDKCLEYKDRYSLNFSSYYTPAENLCYTAMNKFRDRFGVIPNISDKEYFTNSVHVPVWEEINPFDKIDIEAQLDEYSRAGCICYVEIDNTCQNNIEALEGIVHYAMEKDIPYFAINVPNATCMECGYNMFDSDICPNCYSDKVQRLARVTGYLSTDYRHFNKGKQAEVNDRFKHTTKIKWIPKIPK